MRSVYYKLGLHNMFKDEKIDPNPLDMFSGLDFDNLEEEFDADEDLEDQQVI